MAKFEPGQSGNPGGRPKSKELRDALRGFTDKARAALDSLVLGGTFSRPFPKWLSIVDFLYFALC